MARHRRATTKSLERRCARCPGDRPRRPIECPLLTALNSPTRPLPVTQTFEKRTSLLTAAFQYDAMELIIGYEARHAWPGPAPSQ